MANRDAAAHLRFSKTKFLGGLDILVFLRKKNISSLFYHHVGTTSGFRKGPISAGFTSLTFEPHFDTDFSSRLHVLVVLQHAKV